MHEDRFRVAVSGMTCADCGKPLRPLDKGAECKQCNLWPVCHDCMNQKHNHAQ